MITDSYNESEIIISPKDFYGEREKVSDICIITFSKDIFYEVIKKTDAEKISEIDNCNKTIDIYAFDYNGKKIGIYISELGSAIASMCLMDVNHLIGATKFVMFGSCGVINDIAKGKYVIPTTAYRDEGMSYHYKKPSDDIEIKNAKFVEEVFKELKLPYICGKVWTTDAIYKETKDNVKKMKDKGYIAVEMELAGVEAVCQNKSIELYDFLQSGDVLSDEFYDVVGIKEANHALDKFYIALKIIEKIS